METCPFKESSQIDENSVTFVLVMMLGLNDLKAHKLWLCNESYWLKEPGS